MFDDIRNFDNFNFPSRGSTYKIVSGGWILYSEPNFEGKVVVHLPGKKKIVDKNWIRNPSYMIYESLFVNIPYIYIESCNEIPPSNINN